MANKRSISANKGNSIFVSDKLKTDPRIDEPNGHLDLACFPDVEASKLTLWRLKSELTSTQTQLIAVSRQLESHELQLKMCMLEAKRRRRGLVTAAKQCTAMKDKDSSWALQKTKGFSKVVCSLFGKSRRSEVDFVRLTQDLIIEEIEDWSLDFCPQLVKLEGLKVYAAELESQLNKGKFTGLMSAFAAWCCQAYLLALLEQTTPELVESAVQDAKTRIELWAHRDDLLDTIAEAEEKLKVLCSCIDDATRTPSSVQSIGPIIASKQTLAVSFAFRHDKSESIVLNESQQDQPPSYIEVFEESVHKDISLIEQTHQSPTVTEELQLNTPPTASAVLIARPPMKRVKKKSSCCGLFG